MKKIAMTIGAFTITFASIAQVASNENPNFLHDPMLPYYAVTAVMLLVTLMVFAVAFYTIRLVNVITKQAPLDNAAKSGMKVTRPPSWWDRLMQRMNASIPVEQEKEIELEHNYDGIRELDNHLPPWWKWLFYGTIGWAVVYMIVFHYTDTLPLSEQEYINEVALADEEIKKFQAAQPQAVVDENSLQYSNDAAILEKGRTIFMNNNCAGCHRNDGGGNTIGPNLTDEYWIHGGALKNIFNTIKNGAVEKGMPAWGKAMSSQDVRDVTFFVVSLQGTNPPEGKGPQGEVYKQESVKTDTLKAQAGL